MNIEPEILDIIESGTSEGNQYKLPDVKLDRKIYVAVNKVLELLGGKWNKKLKVHIFPDSIEDAIDSVILTGKVLDIKKELQFFETPPELAERLVRLAEVEERMYCLEPSAGKGNIAEALAKVVGQSRVICYDINIEFKDILRKKGFKAEDINFIKKDIVPNAYNRIVMNPPFSKQQDIDHVLHALKFLSVGGVLVSVMSRGSMFRQNKKTKNFWGTVRTYEYSSTDLPEESFKASGTKVDTIVIKIRK